MTPLETVLRALTNAGKQPKQTSQGWRALCPAHDDHNPSLDLKETEDRTVLLVCRSRCCQPKAILESIGLELKDLFCSQVDTRPSGKATMSRSQQSWLRFEDACAALQRKCGNWSRLPWEYHNPNGEITSYVFRFDPKGKPKYYQPISLFGEGWRIQFPPTPRPLFNLPEVNASKSPILFLEGEKCACIAKELGFVATTTMGGANSAHLTNLKPLAGKEVWILPDNNKPGKEYAEKLLELFRKLESRPKVKVLELPELLEDQDIEQFRIRCQKQGMSNEEIKQEILRLADQTPFHEWPAMEQIQPQPKGKPESERSMKLIRASDVPLAAIDWLWEGYIPLEMVTLLSGKPDAGKSNFTCALSKQVTRGETWPDGSRCPQGSILFCADEDSYSQTINPRLLANGANLSKVFFCDGIICKTSETETESSWNIVDLDILEQGLRENPDIRVVVIDPIGSYVGGKTDTHRDNEVREKLRPLKLIAEKYRVAIILVCHVGKTTRENADDNILGCVAFYGVARASFHIRRDKIDKEKRVFAAGKLNIAKPPPAWSYQLNIVQVGFDEQKQKPIFAPKLCWDEEPIEGINADDFYRLDAPHTGTRGPKANKLEEAKDWLIAFLKDGEKAATEVYGRADSVGIPKSTLNRAKEALEINPKKKGSSWYWSLPQTHEEPSHLGYLEPTTLGNPMNMEDTQQGENLSILEDTQVSPTTENGCLPNCQEEQATETDDTPSPLAGRNLFEEFPEQRLPD